MAKHDWVEVNPVSGEGSGNVSVWSDVYYGRLNRTSTLTFTPAGISPPIVVNVIQETAGEFVECFDQQLEITNSGVFNFSSNAQKLTFSLDSDAITGFSIQSITVNGTIPVAEGADIPGDIGASDKYDVRVEFTIDANDSIDDRMGIISITAPGGEVDYCSIIQHGAEPYFSIDTDPIVINSNGDQVEVAVSTNTYYEIS